MISNSSTDLNITGFFNRKTSYIIEHTVPFILSPYSSEPIKIKFKPITEGFYKDTLHIRSDTDTSRIAQVMILTGQSDSTILGTTEKPKVNKFVLEQNYPNPFNPVTKIKYSISAVGTQPAVSVILKVYDILGNEVATLVNEEKPAGSYEVNFDANNLSSGIYFYKIQQETL